MQNKKTSGVPTSNVFYTFGFLLLYIHMCLNIVSLFSTKEFFHSNMTYVIKPFGKDAWSISLGLEEILLIGGFIIFTILGVIIERLRMILLSRQAEVGWSYRNRMKQFYAVIAIILVVWTTIHGYITQKAFDWVWISAGIVTLLYCIFLISYPRIRRAKA